MNFLCYLFIYCLVQTSNALTNATDRRQHMSKHPLVDALIVRLQQETWAEDEQKCLRNTLRILHGVRNNTLWATWIWDSMQAPVGTFYGTRYHFGNFDQCMNIPWKHIQTQYCLVNVEGTTHPHTETADENELTELYLNTVTKHGRPLNQQTLGVCVPSTCSTQAIVKIYKHIHYFTYLPNGNITINERDCQKAGETEPKPMKFFVFWSTVAVIFLIVVLSTVYCNFVEEKDKSIESLASHFDVVLNWQDLFKESSSDVKVMNGMRFLTAVLIVGLHDIFMVVHGPLTNTLDLDSTFNTVGGKIVNHAAVVVETFFMMSGLLLAKGLMSKSSNSLLLTLIKRYLRLIGPLALTMFYIVCSVNDDGSGPVWRRAANLEYEFCEKYWWKNIFMINNDIGTVCYSVTWYISCDYQLAVLATLIFYIYRRNRRIGVFTFFALGLVLSLKFSFDVYMKSARLNPFHSTVLLLDLRNHKIINFTYFNVESQVAVYFIGIAMGYILTVYKPSDYRKVINKNMSFVISILSFGLMLVLLSLDYLCEERDGLIVAAVAPISRALWAMAVCGIIVAAEYGSKNLITEFLSLRIYTPLSKLTYGVYLTHMLVLQRKLFGTKGYTQFNPFSSTINIFGTTVVSLGIALVIYLLVEKPVINISNKIFADKKEILEPNNNEIQQAPKQNGYTKPKVL